MARNKSEKVEAVLVEIAKAWVAWRRAQRAGNPIAMARHANQYRETISTMTGAQQGVFHDLSPREVYALAGVPYGKK